MNSIYYSQLDHSTKAGLKNVFVALQRIMSIRLGSVGWKHNLFNKIILSVYFSETCLFIRCTWEFKYFKSTNSK